MEILILSAGRGSRFYPSTSKVEMNFWGISVLELIIAQAKAANFDVNVILNKNNKVKLKNSYVKVFLQDEEKYGTGAAVQSYLKSNKDSKELLVIPGDSPLIESETLNKFVKHERELKSDILIGVMKTPSGDERYGRIIRHQGKVQKILEYKHYMEKTEYVNTGIIYLNKKALNLVPEIKEHEIGEYYLTNIVEIANEHGLKIDIVELRNDEALGFNTAQEFHHLLNISQNKWRERALSQNAVFFDINSTYLSFDTQFEDGAIVEPNCVFLPGVLVKKNARIKAFSYLANCTVDGIIGPFAHIKSGEIMKNAHIGSFVEVKNSQIGELSKIKHLSYIGDADIKSKVNIGAGVVICNYDGVNKHQTEIEKNAFIGGNSSLIAPIKIGESAFLAAGGTYTNNVEKDDFSIARAVQKTMKNKNKQ